MRRVCGALLPLLIFCNFKPVHLKKLSHPDCLPGLSENEFVFGGNGYVSLENGGFESRKLSQIKFGFKTSVDEGLIYFTVTPDRHFESLELRNGKVIYQFQLNSGQVEMATEKRYDDGKWHVLEVTSIQKESSLMIDDSVESVARYPEQFKSLNFKSAVYFGGFKGQHNIEGITAKGFNGSIRDVQLGGISRRLSMHTEMKNARSGCPRRRRRQVVGDHGPRTGYACEGSTLKLECAPGQLIHILKANYGRFNMTICNNNETDELNHECKSSRSLKVVSEICHKRQETCFIQATNQVFGDPCPETSKYLEVDYSCEADHWPNFIASYIGSTNVELRWNIIANTTDCYDSFRIQWRKLEEASETESSSKTVTDYLVEIDELEPNTTYMFTLNGRINGEDNILKKRTYSTREVEYPSLIVTSVTNSSLSVRWEPLENFAVSLSGNSANITITDGTNFTFENLMPGGIYDLVYFHTTISTERKVVTSPNPVYAEAHASGTEINLKWEKTADVEVMYRGQQPEVCKVARLPGTSGKISELSYGCMYKLDVFAVSGRRRSGSSQTIHVEINAKQTEIFECSAGEKEGQISCDLESRPSNACFKYQLNFSSSDGNVHRETSHHKIMVDSLKPGRTYSISIVSIAQSGNSTSAETTNATAKTGIDQKFLENVKSATNSIELRYFKDEKRVIDYYNVTSNETSYFLNGSITSVTLDNLEAGHCYSFTAYAVSQDVPSDLIQHDICTVPYPPSSVRCAFATNRSLVVAIEKPDAGHVDHYEITATGGGGEPVQKTESANASTVRTKILELRPYTSYKITIKSALKGRKVKSAETLPIICKTAEGIPSSVQYFQNVSSGSNSVRLTWLRPLAENGVITLYVIRIYPTAGSNTTIEVPAHQLSYELSYPNVYAGNTFKISIAARTSVGEGPVTSILITLKEEQSNAVFVALASLLAILFAVLIALLLFYYIRKSPQRMMSIRRMSNRLRNPADIAMVFPQPSYTSKPIKISEFLECIKLLERDSGLKFSEEYEDLKYVGRNQSRDEAELQCNRVKNRFTNILPYDISRVKLLPMEDEDGSDYINANWIPGFHSKREFIATQGPLPSTINDFWRMVWENNCQAIVMLTQCLEKGHIKCEQYWPFDKEPVFYGDLKVEIQTETKTDEWNILELKISLGAQSRKLKHFHYAGWPDMYVPEKQSLLAFVRLVRESINTSNSKGPTVVHCSAGVGRTGTFVALDTLMLHIQESHDLDVYGIVFQMRMNRVLMVQTEAQYVFIYECLNQVLEEPTGEVEKTKAAITEGGVKMEDLQEEPNEKESEPKPISDSKEERNKTESEPKPNCDSKEEPNKTESEPKPNSDSKEEPKKTESEPRPNSDSKEEPNKKELESKPNSDSNEEPSKKELEPRPNSDSSEKKSNSDTVNNSDPEPQKENATKEEDTNK